MYRWGTDSAVSTYTAAQLSPLLVRPPGTVSQTLSKIRTPSDQQLTSGAC